MIFKIIKKNGLLNYMLYFSEWNLQLYGIFEAVEELYLQLYRRQLLILLEYLFVEVEIVNY